MIFNMKFKLLVKPYFWQDLKWKVLDFFNPRQKWLFKKIGNSWKDKGEIIRETLFECVVHFVDEEGGLEGLKFNAEHISNQQEKREEYQKVLNILNWCYDYITRERPRYEKLLDESYPKRLLKFEDEFNKAEDGHSYWKSCEQRYGMPFEEAYRDVFYWEKEIKRNDDRVLRYVVEYRDWMWT